MTVRPTRPTRPTANTLTGVVIGKLHFQLKDSPFYIAILITHICRIHIYTYQKIVLYIRECTSRNLRKNWRQGVAVFMQFWIPVFCVNFAFVFTSKSAPSRASILFLLRSTINKCWGEFSLCHGTWACWEWYFLMTPSVRRSIRRRSVCHIIP